MRASGACHEYRNGERADSRRSRCGTRFSQDCVTSNSQELSLRILGRAGDVVRAGGRLAAIGLLGSVAMVVTLMRTNITQEVAGAIFGASQATFPGAGTCSAR